ncbi:MAG: N-acetylmuramoyl-L-alanine amidase [Rhodobacterales bacterium]
MVVIHYTAMETADAACTRLCDAAAEVSAHYLISGQGKTTQLVPEDMRAWHAGAGAWGDVTDVNSHSIGIELANTGSTPFAAAQMDALEALLADIQGRRAIPAARVIGHSDMAPARKFDPGPRFDWRRLALGRFSVWPEDVQAVDGTWADFLTYANTFGYRCDDKDAVLSAFRLRFWPLKTSTLDAVDIGTMKRLSDCWPCAAK